MQGLRYKDRDCGMLYCGNSQKNLLEPHLVGVCRGNRAIWSRLGGNGGGGEDVLDMIGGLDDVMVDEKLCPEKKFEGLGLGGNWGGVALCDGNMTMALIGSDFAGEGVAKGVVGGILEGENWNTGDVSGELLSDWLVLLRLGWSIRGSGFGWFFPVFLIPGDLRFRPFHFALFSCK